MIEKTISLRKKRKERVLFLCTGNYYRSRLAEEIFNYCAILREKRYFAISRGLAPNVNDFGNFGPISQYALQGLKILNIHPRYHYRPPRSAQIQDFDKSNLVIALCNSEHKPLIEKYFPNALARVIFWDIPDIKYLSFENATISIYMKVQDLVDSL